MTLQASLETTNTTAKKTPLIYKILVIAAMMTVMGGTLTGVMTYVNVGYSSMFYMDWLTSFLTAVVVMMPSGFVFMMLISKIVSWLLPKQGEKTQNFVVGLVMAVVMESVMALTTAANNIGFADSGEFLSAWLAGFAAALPIGLVLAVVMSMTIKPKLEKFMKS
ncbi:DUF2798 domain-containing protein [Saccharospirillum alexandrii]|uniref:DUF2798 domain-containing protein n=1 Tax=Saccharospirillum alexandrii TaxID=2448477 RepID=UPI000FDBA160|nr:DUF2798 domain-containing protein [Saccharospirillum alexandrii]